MENKDELQAAAAFSRQSSLFDGLYGNNTIIKYKRQRVRDNVNRYLPPGSNILELNAGTGEDSIYFAQQGHRVHATDISSGMQEILARKINEHGLEHSITTELCSFNHLNDLKRRGPYNLIFSNFAGLNCTDQLKNIIASFHSLLQPDGLVTMVIMPPFCLWELTLALQGNFKAAFRRFNSKNGVTAFVEAVPFTCWYYTPSQIVAMVKDRYEILSIEGLCAIVPPSYFENFAEKHPKTFKRMVSMENRNKFEWPWRSIGDYFIVTLRKDDNLTK